MATVSYHDDYIYNPEELDFKKKVQALFKSGLSREEILLLADRAMYGLVLCDWQLTDAKACETLDVSSTAFVLKRNLLGLIRNKETEYDVEKTREYQQFYYENVTKKKRAERSKKKKELKIV